jgi:glycosyltransferase involved in cell wall biosynthesis
MKKVLIIAYYWPPTGGSGVQRWLKFVKNLQEFGWEPIIYTPEKPNVQERDETLLIEVPPGIKVLKTPVFEVSKFFGQQGKTNQSNRDPSIISKLKKTLGNYIRGNCFIPDPRILWVNPSVKFLSNYLQQNKIDAIVSTGPPHSLHLIALKIAKKHGIPWLADFRDPWLEILNFHGFSVSSKTLKKHEQLLKQVLTNANSIVAVHESVRKRFMQQTIVPVKLITNGYDLSDLESTSPINLEEGKLNLVFVGIFYNIRNSVAFWQGLSELIAQDPFFGNELRLTFVGKIHQEIMNDLEKYGLLARCYFTGYIPHSIAVSYQKQADALLLFTPALPEFKYEIPAKLFEYLAVRKPIICIADPDNDSAQIVTKMKAGFVIHPEKKAEIKEVIHKIWDLFRKGELRVNPENLEQYERKNLTKSLVTELNRITEI